MLAVPEMISSSQARPRAMDLINVAFLTNHVDGIAAIDLFVLPTITFRLLYCLVILRHARRLWVSFGVTTNPTAEWISRLSLPKTLSI